MFKIKLLLYAETFELAVKLWIPTKGCAACLTPPRTPLVTKPPIIHYKIITRLIIHYKIITRLII